MMNLKRIKQIEKDYDCTILYVTESGSGLYGTKTPTSDTDYLGVFLPNKDSMYLGKPHKFIKLDTNPTNKANTPDDVDIHLHTVQKYMSLLAAGETGAVDIHFSMFRKDTIVYMDPRMQALVDNSSKMFCSSPQAFVGYCISQTKKYNIRGERYGELVGFTKTVSHRFLTVGKLGDTHFDLSPYKFIKYVQAPAPRGSKDESWTYLEVLGKKYAPTVTLEYLLERLVKMQNSYGKRAKNSMDGKDWKSMSHAVRVILEIEELLSTGIIKFPLEYAGYVKEVKAGTVDIEDVTQLLDTKVGIIDSLVEKSTLPKSVDRKFMNEFTLSLYRDKPSKEK